MRPPFRGLLLPIALIAVGIFTINHSSQVVHPLAMSEQASVLVAPSQAAPNRAALDELAAERHVEARAAQEAQRIAAAKAAASRASRGAVRPRFAGPINDDVFIRLSWCEAGGRPTAVSRNGKYFGAFQFSLGTWHGIGMSGNPIDFPYEVQLDAAKRLQARSGWGQWPVCSRKLGLR